MSDLGVNNTNLLIDELKNKKINTNNNTQENVAEFLEKQFSNINHELNLKPNKELRVILVFGVNGSGKTTTIAKLAKKGKDKKLKVLLAAADTFRAAAKEQIEKWANIIQIEVLSGNIGEDPSSVVFKAHRKAIDEKFDLLIIDTAGRLHNKVELMEELKKMTRIIQKNDEEAPHNKILVLDSTIGQNTYNQIDSFHQNIGLTGVIMTKLDGSAKGGSLIGITRKYNLPIHALGVGEKIDDLIPFIPKDFINALLGDNTGEKKMKAYIKLFCEVIPLIVFFLVNSYDKVILKEIPLEGIFQATFYFIIVSIVVIPIAWYIDRKIPWMPIVTGAFLIVFGSLTIFLKDDFFIKFKPTLN